MDLVAASSEVDAISAKRDRDLEPPTPPPRNFNEDGDDIQVSTVRNSTPSSSRLNLCSTSQFYVIQSGVIQMSESATPRNRRERRAAVKEAAKRGEKLDHRAPMKMEMPDYDSKPTVKTLYDLAAEQQELLAKGKPFPKTAADAEDEEELGEVDIGALGNAVLYWFSLSMLHLTLDVLVLFQYRQDIKWIKVFGRLLRLSPALLLVLYFFHRPEVKRWKISRQLFFLIASVAAGSWVIHSGNVNGYYAVMKQVPPLGTLWVWSVVEMDLLFALAHVVAVGSYMWWGRYGAF
jgi:hypothetical protein